MWHLKPFSSRHCFSHIWQYQRSFWSPLDLMLFEIHFGVPTSAFPILFLLCSYSILIFLFVCKRFLTNYLRMKNFEIRYIFLVFVVFSFCCCFAGVLDGLEQRSRFSPKISHIGYIVHQLLIWIHFINKKATFFNEAAARHAALKLKCLQLLWNPGWWCKDLSRLSPLCATTVRPTL